MKQTIYYVTTNPGKFDEVSRYIKRFEPSIDLQQFSADIEEIQTMDQQAIAIDKAKKAWNLLKKPLLLDDAAMYFDKYDRFPGTLSKFVSQGIGFDGLKKLVDEGDKAHFLLYMIYVEGPEQLNIFEGRCDGTIAKPEHFDADPHRPYDALFIPEGATVTKAKMYNTLEDHSQFFYRLKALKKFLYWYKNRAQKQ
jgi:non-canonical purine NTP pyrophosphatase (RdgB/HAM1 family)